MRNDQKEMIKSDTAADFPTNFHIDGSYVEGLKMVKNQVGLMLRGFNGECEAAVAQVKYSNVVALEKRIRKSFKAINKLGATLRIRITDEFLALKLAELHLVHEHREKVHLEREEQRAIKARMREEQKAEKELLKAQKKAEKEEMERQRALAEARAELEEARRQQQEELERMRHELGETELERAKLERSRKELEARTGKQHEKLEALVGRLETELSEALDVKAKAIARARLTRSGHVYVISNIGSFGEGCFKIGLTRRLDPLDRVKELGDASVPFPFDVHAIIYSEDAPALEAALHHQFAAHRVNKVNTRKEYFRVSLDDIRQAVAKHHGIITFVTVPEAEEYRKTLALEAELEPAEAG